MKSTTLLLLAVLFTATEPVLAIHPAVEISITGIGPPVDSVAYRAVRRVIGRGVANGSIDRFIVRGYGIEGGFTACVEAAEPHGRPIKLNGILQQLRKIRPNPRTTAYSVVPSEGCGDLTGVCAQDVKLCPDGSFVSRMAPDCSFAPCPGQ
jgi:hypothetical protein